jgi:hypothetical protein
LQNVANNLPDTFTEYRCVMKSYNPTVNSPARMEVPNKTIQAPSVMKRWRATIIKKDNTSNKHPRKEKTRPLQKTVNVGQQVVDRHLVDINMPQYSTQAHRKTLTHLYWEIMRSQMG